MLLYLGVLQGKMMMKKLQINRIHPLLKSFVYAFDGIKFALKTQRNPKIHFVLGIVVICVGLGLKIQSTDWRWIIMSITLVWFAELMNSAFEFLCDIVMPEWHDSVKRAKDIAAGAVLICAVGSAIIGVLTFWPYV
jgi:diacylglycerol kinase (ATP)